MSDFLLGRNEIEFGQGWAIGFTGVFNTVFVNFICRICAETATMGEATTLKTRSGSHLRINIKVRDTESKKGASNAGN